MGTHMSRGQVTAWLEERIYIVSTQHEVHRSYAELSAWLTLFARALPPSDCRTDHIAPMKCYNCFVMRYATFIMLVAHHFMCKVFGGPLLMVH